MKHEIQKLGREAALELVKTNWWENKSPRELAEFQLLTAELCMPFEKFHEALETALNRPVWTHELALNHAGLISELFGESPSPSFEDIINLIPKEKRILVEI